jgi:hypothetical protein
MSTRSGRNNNLMRTRLASLLVAAVFTTLAAACGGGDAASDADSAGGMSQGMPGMDAGMQGMPGMAGMGGGGGMAMDSAMMARMSQMQQHMTTMAALGVDSMMAMLPLHRQMTANELAEMNLEMQKMKMAPDSGWNALVDSVRTDLRTMPGMSGTSLHSMMPQHVARMMRLMQMHRDMMVKMPG